MRDKKLYRSKEDRQLSGVIGGLGDYLDVDSTLLRLAFVALTISSVGGGLIFYIIAAAIIPENPVQ